MRLIAQAAGSEHDPAVDISIAEVYAFRGDDDEALKWVTRALQKRSGRNWTREEMIQSPFLNSLHADARWHTLLASAEYAVVDARLLKQTCDASVRSRQWHRQCS